MFVITLRFTDKTRVPQLMDGHGAWLGRGFDDGVFLLVGGLDDGAGGLILAHGSSREEIEARLRDDPFVAEGVVDVDVTAVAPRRADPRLDFLKG